MCDRKRSANLFTSSSVSNLAPIHNTKRVNKNRKLKITRWNNCLLLNHDSCDFLLCIELLHPDKGRKHLSHPSHPLINPPDTLHKLEPLQKAFPVWERRLINRSTTSTSSTNEMICDENNKDNRMTPSHPCVLKRYSLRISFRISLVCLSSLI